MFILIISYLNHARVTLIHGPKIPGSYAILFFCSIGFFFHHQTHPQLNIVSALAQLLYFSGATSSSPPLFPSSILDTSALGDPSFSVISFCLFIQFVRFLPLVDHVLSEVSHKIISWFFLAETLQGRRERHDTFKVMRGKNLQPRISYPVSVLFRFHVEMKCFTDNQELRESSITKSSLQQLLNELL